MFIQLHNKEILSDLRPVEKKDLVNEKGNDDFPEIFFVHAFDDKIEEHRRHKGFKKEKWDPWLKKNRIYVKKKKILKVNESDLI